jgi:hypothetical protein
VIGRVAPDLARYRTGRPGVEIGDVHRGAVPRKQPGGRGADPGSGTGHDRCLAGQVNVFRHGDSYLLVVGLAGPE